MNTKHVGHDHTHGMARRALRLAFFLTIIIVAAQVIGGIFAHSLALLSDAGHALTDLFALGLAWFAAAQVERPANARKTFGYYRVGILAAQINAITLILVAVWVLYEAIQRFQHPEPVEPVIMFISAGIGIVVNLFIGFGLNKEGDNLNAKAAALHVFGDVGASIGVIIAGIIILLTGWYPMDPILSVGIAGLIAIGAWRILRETTSILLESTPRSVDLPTLVTDMQQVQRVENVHDVHVWCITDNMYALSAHIHTADMPLSESALVLQEIETLLRETYRIGHTTLQFECGTHHGRCSEIEGLYCQMENYQDHDEEKDATLTVKKKEKIV